jgi:hypothetical protein
MTAPAPFPSRPQGSQHKPREGGLFIVLPPGPYNMVFLYDHLHMESAPVACPQLHMELAVLPGAPRCSARELRSLLTRRAPARARGAVAAAEALPQARAFKGDKRVCGGMDHRPSLLPDSTARLLHAASTLMAWVRAGATAGEGPADDTTHTVDGVDYVIVNTAKRFSIPETGYIFNEPSACRAHLAARPPSPLLCV